MANLPALIRPLAIGVFRHDAKILVAHGTDPVSGERFMRPLGGQIEFGEPAADALRRELREELDAEIELPTRLGVLENLFTYGGQAHHEIVFVFDATFRDRSLYTQQEIPIAEDVWDGPATWVSLGILAAGNTPLYPEGLFDLLRPTGTFG